MEGSTHLFHTIIQQVKQTIEIQICNQPSLSTTPKQLIEKKAQVSGIEHKL